MKRTTEETALLIALLLKRAGGTRGRVSESTVRRLSKRHHLRSAFKDDLRKELEDLGLLFVEIDRGGFGLQRHTALNGAPALTAKRYLADELPKLDEGRIRFDKIREEVETGEADEEDTELRE